MWIRRLSLYFRKAMKLIAEGRYWDLMRKVCSFVPVLHRMGNKFTDWYLRRKYSKLIREFKDTHKLQEGKGHKNIIWWMWLQGEENAPDICKACLASLRRWHPDKEIIILDKNNISQYINLPEYITRKYEQGIISNTHYSDIVRLQLLVEHGGTWIDSTVFCTGRKYEYIMHLPLFVFQKSETGVTLLLSSSFMASDPDNPILALSRDLIFAYWKDHNFLMHYFLVHLIFTIAADVFREDWNKVAFLAAPNTLHVLQIAVTNGEKYSEERMKYFEEASDFHKLSYKEIAPGCTLPSSFYYHLTELYRKDFDV